MRILSTLIISLLFIVMLSLSIMLLSLPLVLTPSRIKQSLPQIQAYERLITVIKTNKPTINYNSLFSQITDSYLEKIITKDWVYSVLGNLIDHGYKLIVTNQDWQEINIDLKPLKKNYLDIIKISPIRQNADKLAPKIPDTIPFTQLIKTPPQDIASMINLVRQAVNFYKITTLVSIIMTLLLILISFLLFSKHAFAIWLSTNTLLTGILYLVFGIIFQIFITNPTVVSTTQSIWPHIQILLTLTLVETVIKVWIIIGISLLLVSITALALLVIRQTNGHNTN